MGRKGSNPVYNEFMKERIAKIKASEVGIEHSKAYNLARAAWLNRMEEVAPLWELSSDSPKSMLEETLTYLNVPEGFKFLNGISTIEGSKPIITPTVVERDRGRNKRNPRYWIRNVERIERPERIIVLLVWLTPKLTTEENTGFVLGVFPFWKEEEAEKWREYQYSLATSKNYQLIEDPFTMRIGKEEVFVQYL